MCSESVKVIKMVHSDLRKLKKKERQLRDMVEAIEEFVNQFQEARDRGSVPARLTL